MRFFFCTILLVLSFLPSSVKAEQKPVAYYKEMDRFYKGCEVRMLSWYHDCRCLSVRYMDIWEKLEPNITEHEILLEITDGCPNSSNIGLKMYEQCMSWAYKIRKDYKEFCTCYASAYVKKYEKKISFQPLVIQKRMADSLNECNFGQNLMERYHRRKKVKDKKEKKQEERKKYEQQKELYSDP